MGNLRLHKETEIDSQSLPPVWSSVNGEDIRVITHGNIRAAKNNKTTDDKWRMNYLPRDKIESKCPHKEPSHKWRIIVHCLNSKVC